MKLFKSAKVLPAAETRDQRRQVLKAALGIVGAGLLLPTLLNSPALAEERRRGKKPEAGAGGGDLALPLVEPGKGMAAGVNYQHRHADVKDAKLKTDRQGVKFEAQFCDNCMLYSPVGEKSGEKVGKCTLFANQLVKGKGWCTTWAKKA